MHHLLEAAHNAWEEGARGQGVAPGREVALGRGAQAGQGCGQGTLQGAPSARVCALVVQREGEEAAQSLTVRRVGAEPLQG